MQRARLVAFLAVGVLATSLAACSGGSNNPTPPGEDCAEGLEVVKNSEFCEASASEIDCDRVTPAFKNQACGVPLRAPPGELRRSPNVKKFAGSGAPSLGCFAVSNYPEKPGAPQTVTVEGVAEIFSNGCESKDLTIEIYTVKRTGGEEDGDLDKLVGAATKTAGDCKVSGVATEHDKCGTRYECTWQYAGVPTETELVVKTHGAIWAPLYEYNVYFGNAEVQDGKVAKDIRALAQDDYGTISQAALGKPMTATYGAIAGEVHDCDDVRLIDAIVDIDRVSGILTYFTSNEDKPLPDLSFSATTDLSLYAAIDVASGPVTVAAAGLVNGEVVSAGHFHARVHPDSVTSVTFRGLRPFQVP